MEFHGCRCHGTHCCAMAQKLCWLEYRCSQQRLSVLFGGDSGTLSSWALLTWDLISSSSASVNLFFPSISLFTLANFIYIWSRFWIFGSPDIIGLISRRLLSGVKCGSIIRSHHFPILFSCPFLSSALTTDCFGIALWFFVRYIFCTKIIKFQ